MYKIKYRKSSYKVNLKVYIKIQRLKLYLLYKRLMRFIKRVFIYNIVNLITILFITIIILGVICLGIYLKEYDNFINGLWEMKDIFITNIILILFVTTYNSEKQRHETLKIQYNIYYSLSYESERYINDLMKIIGYTVNNHIYIDEENYDIFRSKLQKIPNNSEIKYNKKRLKQYILHLNQRFIKMLNNPIFNNSNKFIGVDNSEIYELVYQRLDEINYEFKSLKIDNLNTEFLKGYINDISNTLYLLIARYRRPWRWDIKVDKDIRKILNENAEFFDGLFNTLRYYDIPYISKYENNNTYK